jgi:hypothetical protein
VEELMRSGCNGPEVNKNGIATIVFCIMIPMGGRIQD